MTSKGQPSSTGEQSSKEPTTKSNSIKDANTDNIAGKDVELALHQAQAYAEAIVQTMPDSLLVLDRKLRVKFANDAFYATFRFQPEETVGRLIYKLGSNEWDIPQLRLLLEDILPRSHTFSGYELSHQFEQLGPRTLLLNGRRLDHVELILLIIADITDRKNAEERLHHTIATEAALRASEEQLHLLLESVQDYAIFTLDLAGSVTSWNKGARRLTGYTTNEIIGKSLHSFYLPEDLAAGKPELEMQRALTTGRSEDESWRVRKDGSHFWANEIITPLRAEDGMQIGFTKVSRDLSERRQALEALRVSEERLRLILESINDFAIFTQDEAGLIVDWNSGAERVFGFSAEEAIGQPSAMVFTPEDRANNVPAQEIYQARTTGRAADERWHIRKDGTRFFASGVLTPLQEGTHSGYVKVARDLTERREMEERLEAQVKERTWQVRDLVTQLTMSEQEERRRVSGILHDDLQQRLFSLMFQLTLLRQALNESQPHTARQIVTDIEEGLRRSVQITRELSVDLSPPVLHGEGLGAAIRWLAAQMDQQQGLTVDVQAEKILPLLNEDLRVLLFQIVRELLFNVVKHAGVNTAQVAIAKDGDHLRIDVSDQGQGFTPDDGSDNNRVSQGLTRIGQRMQLLGGRMENVSAPGQGTRISLYVPVQGREGKHA